MGLIDDECANTIYCPSIYYYNPNATCSLNCYQTSSCNNDQASYSDDSDYIEWSNRIGSNISQYNEVPIYINQANTNKNNCANYYDDPAKSPTFIIDPTPFPYTYSAIISIAATQNDVAGCYENILNCENSAAVQYNFAYTTYWNISIPYWTRYNYIYQNYLNVYACYNKSLEIYWGDLAKFYNLVYQESLNCFDNYEFALYYATLNAEYVAYNIDLLYQVNGQNYPTWSYAQAGIWSCHYVYNAQTVDYENCKWVSPLGNAINIATYPAYQDYVNTTAYVYNAGTYLLLSEASVNRCANYVYYCALLLSYF